MSKLSFDTEATVQDKVVKEYKQIKYIEPGITQAVITEFRDCTKDEEEANWKKPYISVSFLEPSSGAVLNDRWGMNSKLMPGRKFSDLQTSIGKIKHLFITLNPDADLPTTMDVTDIAKYVVGKEARFKFSGKEAKTKKGNINVFANIGFPVFVERLDSEQKMNFDETNKYDFKPYEAKAEVNNTSKSQDNDDLPF